jgi:FtsZ-interacting cell division protein ZipA
MKKIITKFGFNNVAEVVIIVGVAAILILLVRNNLASNRERAEADNKKMAIACPSLLSIARSPRDTLIIMRNEDKCVKYVLDNIK